MKEQFTEIRFSGKTKGMIHIVNEIIDEVLSQGYASMTLRQLFYQLVRRDMIPNKQTEYKRLGEIISHGRLGGWIDWDAIEDRTRGVRGVSHHADPSDIINTASNTFRIDKWHNQSNRVEVWVEKDALVGVVEKACRSLDVRWFSCRGYTSQTGLYDASKRLLGYTEEGKEAHVIHLGDHDPSGIDMTRDIRERLETFGADVMIHRIALNMDQVKKYNPPPNPAKQTDSRYDTYKKKHGVDCWELDALELPVMEGLIVNKIKSLRSEEEWDTAVAVEATHRTNLATAASRWPEVEKFLNKPPRKPRKKATKKKK